MKTYAGVGYLQDDPDRQVDLTIELVAGYVIVRGSGGKKLMSSLANKVRTREDGGRLALTAPGFSLSFDAADRQALIEGLTEEGRRFGEVAPSYRIAQAARMGTITHGRTESELVELESPVEADLEPLVIDLDRELVDLEPESVGSEADQDLALVGLDLEVNAVESGPVELKTQDDVVDAMSVPGLHQATSAARRSDGTSPADVMESIQCSVLDALDLATRSWFGYYFRTAEGSVRDRSMLASIGLREASGQLREGARELAAARPSPAVDGYRSAMEGWAVAFSQIALAFDRDQNSMARDGLNRLGEATDQAKGVVRLRLYPDTIDSGVVGVKARVTLDYLRGLRPPVRLKMSEIRRARQPWEQAVVAASAPLRDWSVRAPA